MESIWSDAKPPAWHQLARFLRDDDDVRALLAERLLAVNGEHLTNLERSALAAKSDSTWFEGAWDGDAVLVKVNITERERFWMSTVSERSPDAVARVLASGDDLDDIDVRWLVLERLPAHAPDPPTPAWFQAALDAALAFQAVARDIDTSLVFDEGLAFWERFVCVHAGAAPGPVPELVATMSDDLAWLDAHIERHTLFGDLHFGNMAAAADGAPLQLRLFDPIPRRQPWVFEAVYFEQSHPDGRGLVAAMAKRRRAAGMPTPADDVVARAETILRAWIGVMWWGIIAPLRDDPVAGERLAGWVRDAVSLDR